MTEPESEVKKKNRNEPVKDEESLSLKVLGLLRNANYELNTTTCAKGG